VKILLIDYGAGNIESIHNALLSIKNNMSEKLEILISNKVSDLKSADHFILPGVGAFCECMNGLKLVENFLPELRNQVLNEKKPFLGICVGMQVLASIGYENGEHQGLNFINGKVEKIKGDDLKIPHMGWNNVSFKSNNGIKTHKVLQGIKDLTHFYFANSYHFICQNENNILAQTEYGSNLTAIIAKDSIFGIQFHPEKSGTQGLLLLQNFLNWRP
jgi:glutamine amidotransferase